MYSTRLYLYPRCGKSIQSISRLTRHINTCKTLIMLPSRFCNNQDQPFLYRQYKLSEEENNEFIC